VVKEDGYDPRGAFGGGPAVFAAPGSRNYAANAFSPHGEAPTEGQPARARWFWQEDAANLDKHNPKDVKDGFVAYAGSVCAELDQKWHAWVTSGRSDALARVDVDLADRIGSTGTEQKAHNAHTGVIFTIDLGSLKQINKKSGFRRAILREEFAAAVAASEKPKLAAGASAGQQARMMKRITQELGLPEGMSADRTAEQAANILGIEIPPGADSTAKLKQVYMEIYNGQPVEENEEEENGGGFFGGLFGASQPAQSSIATISKMKTRARMKRGTHAIDKLQKPADIAHEDSLVCYPGQLLQTSKTRPDGWAFGSVVYDPDAETRAVATEEGISNNAGWFPLEATDLPTPDQLGELQKIMGGGDGASDALKVPDTWGAVKDPLTPELVTLKKDSAEFRECSSFFMKTLQPNIKVQSIERIQNISMWQSYAVKRQTTAMREPDAEAALARFERRWLFHGTDGDTVPKIIGMGFNRSFCGKNATRFGKGVYFARDASYSSSAQYSQPDRKGFQHMFLCRVTVGEFCLGKNDAPAPDVRKGHQLYDSTVNDMKHPSIFVAYHDAQAYPEYLVKFSQ